MAYVDGSPMDPNKLCSITDIAKFIRTKKYGRDVREAIAQGFERWYQDEKSWDLGKLMTEDGQEWRV
ncbi:hypothetical protein [Aerococcus sanguinicola]|uniref:hypothetical protein n=2 Tax=Aerococcus sanguinicola TaxID=119206 RepID=UPI0018A70AB9|nr:hypothetical protein [Aerococcus sanguinicola]